MPNPEHNVEHFDEPRVTTIGDRAHRASIEPYGARPVVALVPGLIGCTFCGNTKFRRSRVRVHDLREVLMLRYPLRCTRCNERQFGYFMTAAFALAPKSQAGRVARGKDTWKAWTESEMNGHTSQRPMTTSIGTRATKLHPQGQRNSATKPSPATTNWREEDRQIW